LQNRVNLVCEFHNRLSPGAPAFDPPGRHLLRRVLSELFWREFAALYVAFVYFGVVFPLLGQIVQRENRGDWADGYARAAINALHGVNVKLRDFLECWPAVVVGRVLLGVDAIYGAGIDAGGVLHPNAGLGNDIRHKPPPSSFTVCLPQNEFNLVARLLLETKKTIESTQTSPLSASPPLSRTAPLPFSCP